MPKAKTIGTDLTQGSILRLLLIFVLPIFFTNLIQQFYNIVDVIVIGQFAGSEGTVGVSTGGEVINLLTFVSMGFSSAAQVYISQLYGVRDHKKIRETIGTLLCLMGLLSLVFMVLSMLLCTPVLRLMNTPVEALSQSHDYMMITALGMPFIFGYNAVCGILRGMGESKRPLEFIAISATANIFLDLFFVAVLDMRSAGTAWATLLSQFAAFAASLAFMYRKREHFQFDFKLRSFTMKKTHLKVLIELGIPLAASSTFIHLSQLYCNAQVNTFGLVASAVNSVGNKVVRFANIITSSINTGAAAMIGQNLGARKFDRVKKITYIALALASVMALLNCTVCVFAPTAVFRAFSSDPAVIDAGVPFMHISVITFLLSAWQGPYNGVVTGSGHARLSFVIGMLDGVVLRIGISLFLANVMGMGVYGYYYGNALARLAPCVICTWYFYSGRWTRRKLLSEG
ncbi:MATE family efflux transporter [Anaerofilum sp. BX8]|uniref:Probable multidrug resistance protein NorM n=1 Tax=Anaerofilum hominis TaxID=2763016 RepID=A0A923I6I6_9FIRM|nr:MATE family efflux transporter [Anaerofilum hominis]MBC5580729.1 MATE family efflux transporter [Anaerofilum hominis]